jgi:hypothetical protein
VLVLLVAATVAAVAVDCGVGLFVLVLLAAATVAAVM